MIITEIKVLGRYKVGSYRTGFNKGSGSLFLRTLILMIILVFIGVHTVLADGNNTQRAVLYSELNPLSGEYNIPAGNYSLPENVTLALTCTELGFIVVEAPAENYTYYQNELMVLPWVSDLENDATRTGNSIFTIPVNDTLFSDQWALNRTQVPQAWETLTPADNVTVALIDTGVEADHEDLTSHVIPGGYDWISQDSIPQDEDGHGTHLAGIVSALTNNEKGISGIAPVKILSERIGSSSSDMLASYSAVAIRHAVDTGADIILCGYGGSSPSLAEERAVKYAEKKGALIIAPAGNENSNMAHYPSDFFEVISVGSTGKTNGLSYFSNYGIFTELVAPGEDIISTGLNNSYQLGTGTSQAAASVAGIAALMISARPDLSHAEIREVLNTGALDLGRTGRDIYYGWGIVNAENSANILIKKKKESILSNINLRPSVAEQKQFLKRSEEINGTSIAEISLSSGWNFISVPAPFQSGKTPYQIFNNVNTDGHTLWSFQAETHEWSAISSNYTYIPHQGILIYSADPMTIPIVFKSPDNSTMNLNLSKGWNLAGSFSSSDSPVSIALQPISDSWVSLLRFNSSSQGYDPAVINGAEGIYGSNPALNPYEACWIYMNENCTFSGIFN